MKDRLLRFWNSKLSLGAAAGILLGLSYPPFPFPFFVLAAFILLFRIIDLSDTARSAAFYTWTAFLFWNLIATYWLMEATLIGGIMAILANSAVMTVPIAFIHYFKRRIKGIYLTAAVFAASWTSYEYFHYRWDLAWPWLSLGNAFAMTPQLVQFIAWTGTIGITLWIVFASYLLYQFFVTDGKWLGWTALIVILLPIVVSLIKYNYVTVKSDRSAQVLVAQPNYDSYLDMAGYSDPYTPLHKILQQSDSLRTDSTQLILWPENTIQVGIDALSPITKMLSDSSQAWNTTIISGTAFFQFYNPKTAPSLTHKTGSGRPYNVYNAAVTFSPDGSLHVYRKAKLVPLVERVPFVRLLSKIIPGVDWGNIQGFGRGDKATVFKIAPDIHVSADVCYDSVFPNWNRYFVHNGANLISVITNDGWWGYTSGHIQHFEYARLLAIEMHRYVVRSANNGISSVIAPNGNVIRRTKFWTRTTFRSDVPLFSDQTFYVRYGDWVGVASFILFLVILFYSIGKRLTERKSKVSLNESTQ